MKPTIEQLKQLVTEKLDITELLYKYDPDGSYQAGQTCFCPFHDNENTPAASIYDNEGVTTLYCFSEKRLYTSADAIEILLNKDVYQVAQRIWDMMSGPERQQWLNDHSEVDVADLFSDDKKTEKDDSKESQNKTKILNKLSLFKIGKISLEELLQNYIEVGGVK